MKNKGLFKTYQRSNNGKLTVRTNENELVFITHINILIELMDDEVKVIINYFN